MFTKRINFSHKKPSKSKAYRVGIQFILGRLYSKPAEVVFKRIKITSFSFSLRGTKRAQID